ncbi:MAG: YqiA/YcfP family alpha/beta fold hydrolase [Pseudomonadota bacterium]|nr:YqiA/YcfP family alpha/beta fold hydrolase [Pseudomonadota bacterium]
MSSIVFLHGLESGPHGNKAAWLRARYGAFTPALDTTSFDAAVAGAAAALAEHRPRVVVGSSFGGAVATRLLLDGVWAGPTVLIAPAAHRVGLDAALPPGTRAIVIHGDADDVIPLADSQSLVLGAGAGVELWTIAGGDHRLNRILEDGTLELALEKLGVPITLA